MCRRASYLLSPTFSLFVGQGLINLRWNHCQCSSGPRPTLRCYKGLWMRALYPRVNYWSSCPILPGCTVQHPAMTGRQCYYLTVNIGDCNTSMGLDGALPCPICLRSTSDLRPLGHSLKTISEKRGPLSRGPAKLVHNSHLTRARDEKFANGTTQKGVVACGFAGMSMPVASQGVQKSTLR